MKKTFTQTVLILIVITFFAGDVFAIPAFARKYNMTCKTCHSPFPNLKPYGEEFAGNGFVLKDQDAPRYFIDTGDPELSLIRDLPLAMRLEGYVTYNQNNSERSDFNTPVVFKLLSGGSLAKGIAYYVYYALEHGKPGKIEDAWLMFNNLFGSEINLTIGQFQVSDPLFVRELRLTREDYAIYKVKPGDSNVNLAYDRGIMLEYGFENGPDISFLVVNGSGIGEEFFSGTFDNDKYKNFMGRISQEVGEHFRIGAMGYLGKEERQFFIQNPVFVQNKLWMFGADATISLDPIELNLQYVERNDDNPIFIFNTTQSIPKVATRGGLAELIYRPNGDDSKWYAVGLFNWIESDFSNLDYESLTGSIGYLLRRNIRLGLEYSHNFLDKYGTIGIGFVTAF